MYIIIYFRVLVFNQWVVAQKEFWIKRVKNNWSSSVMFWVGKMSMNMQNAKYLAFSWLYIPKYRRYTYYLHRYPCRLSNQENGKTRFIWWHTDLFLICIVWYYHRSRGVKSLIPQMKNYGSRLFFHDAAAPAHPWECDNVTTSLPPGKPS